MMLLSVIVLMNIQICAGLETMFQRSTNATQWRLYEILDGSHFQQCAVWCSHSDRCKSFSMEPERLSCYMYGNGVMDIKRAITGGSGTPTWRKVSIRMVSYRHCLPNDKLTGTTNVALNKTAKQSSSAWKSLPSGAAVDGNTATRFPQGTCIKTNFGGDQIQWWSVDLEDVYEIQKITFWDVEDFRLKSLKDFTVYVGNRSLTGPGVNYKPCLYHAFSFMKKTTLSCRGWSCGQFVRIENTKNRPLQICEVEVYPKLCDND